MPVEADFPAGFDDTGKTETPEAIGIDINRFAFIYR